MTERCRSGQVIEPIEIDMDEIHEKARVQECIEGLGFLNDVSGSLWCLDGSCWVTRSGRVMVMPELFWTSIVAPFNDLSFPVPSKRTERKI